MRRAARTLGATTPSIWPNLAAALTLFGIVRRTLSSSRLATRFGSGAGGLALAVAVLWLVHPLQTQAVTYIYQRRESLMGLFVLLTLYSFIRAQDAAVETYGTRRRSSVACWRQRARKWPP